MGPLGRSLQLLVLSMATKKSELNLPFFVEKKSWLGTGQVLVRSWFGHGSVIQVMVRGSVRPNQNFQVRSFTNAVPSGARKNSRKNSEFSFLFSKLQNMIYHAMIIMHINQDIKYANASLFYVPKEVKKGRIFFVTSAKLHIPESPLRFWG